MRRRARLTWILFTVVAVGVLFTFVMNRTRTESRQAVLGRLGTPIAVATSAIEGSYRGDSLLSSPQITLEGLARYSADHDLEKTWIYDLDDSELGAWLQECFEGQFSAYRGPNTFVAGGTRHLLLVDVDGAGNCKVRKARAVFFDLSR
jgi:hypothetical protein